MTRRRRLLAAVRSISGLTRRNEAMKTLMTTDGSQMSMRALRSAGTLLRKTKNEVDLLCVAPELYIPEMKRKAARQRAARIRESYRRRIALETEAILKKAREALAEQGIDANPISQTGSPSDVILRLAPDYDVIVVGAVGRYHSPNLGLGPVASRVVEKAHGTVLVSRELSGEERLRVLVGVDGSLASRRALATAAACFDLDEAEITILHVKETPWIHLGLDREWFDYSGDATSLSDPEIQFEEELQREAENLLEASRKILENYDYSVITMIAEGSPATEILGEAENGGYDLVVLGATGVTDAKHAMLGSVSAKVAAQAVCSVAIVRHHAE